MILGGIGVAVDFLIEPALAWFVGAPRTLQTIERKISPVEKLVHRMESLTQRATQIGGAPQSTRPATPPPSESAVSTASVMTATGSTLASLLTVVIPTLVLLTVVSLVAFDTLSHVIPDRLV